jgi:hypothetical protein
MNTPGAIRVVSEVSSRASAPQQLHLWTQLLNLIANIPDKVFNILKRETDVRFRKENYFSEISIQFGKCLEKLTVSIQFPFFSAWVAKMDSAGQLDTLFDALDPVAFCSSSPEASKVLANVFNNLPSTVVERALLALFKNKKASCHPKLSSLLLDLLQDLIESSSVARFVLTQKIFLVHSLPWWVLRQVLEFLHVSLKSKKMEWWLEAVTMMATTAGDAKFVKNASYLQQRRLNRALIYIFEQSMVSRSDIEDTELLLALMASVQELLNQPTEKLAVLGMRLGEAFSKIIDPSNPLKFDSPLSFEDEEPDNAPASSNTEATVEQLLDQFSSADSHELGILSDYFDPTMDFMDYVNYFHPVTGDSARDEAHNARQRFRKGKFAQMDLDDDLSDTSEFKTPLYLRDCITSLRSDDPKVLEVTLKILAPLISSRPDDLTELAVSVCSTLLHTNNNYDLEGFDRQKLDALVALVTYEPTRTIPHICKTFYEPNYSLHERYVMLDALSEGSQRLSEHKVDPRPDFNPVALKTLNFSKPPPREPSPRVLVSEQVGPSSSKSAVTLVGKSRRWASERQPVQSFQNRLAPHLDALLQLLHYKEHPKGLQLLMGDPRLLGKLIYAVSVFIECAGPSTRDFESVGRKLLEIVWTMRYHQDPFVRRALLLGIGAFIKTAPAWVLFEKLATEMNEVVAWLEENGKDTDEEVRTLSVIATMQLSTLYKDNPQYQPFQPL